MKQLISLISLIIFCGSLILNARPASAQTGEEATFEDCGTSELTYWTQDNLTVIQNGACILNGGTFSNKLPLMDYDLTFKALYISASSPLNLEFGQVMNSFTLSVSPSRISFIQEVGHGVSSSVTDETTLHDSPANLPVNEWINFDFHMHGKDVSLLVNNEEVVKTQIDRGISNIRLQGGFDAPIQLDDLRLTPVNLSQMGNSLNFNSSELLKTWIAFQGSDNNLWVIHPDGTELRQVTNSANRLYGIDVLDFSPDGRYFAFVSSGGDQSQLRILEMENQTIKDIPYKLPSNRNIDWLSDGQMIIARSGVNPNIIQLDVIDIKSGEMTSTFTLPDKFGQPAFSGNSVGNISASPTQKMVLLSLGGIANGESANRYVVYNFESQQITQIPGNQRGYWAPDGLCITTVRGELVDPQTMEINTTINLGSTNVVGWSPNGQYLYTGSNHIWDIRGQQNLPISLDHYYVEDWSPDSQFIILSDYGRIIIKSLLSGEEIQIAEGFSPHWQPSPTLRNLVQQNPTPTLASMTPSLASSPQITSTSTSTSIITNIVPNAPVEPTNTHGPVTKNFMKWLVIVFGAAAMMVGVVLLLRSLQTQCPDCHKKNPIQNIFCMYCGTKLPGKNSGTMTNKLVSGSLLLIGLMLILWGYSIPAENIHGVENTTLLQPTKPKSNTAQTQILATKTIASVNSICGLEDIQQLTVQSLYNQSKDNRRIGNELIQLQYAMAVPSADGQKATKIAELAGSLNQLCAIQNLSFSPDGKKLLLIVKSSQESASAVFLIIYTADDLHPFWYQRIDYPHEQVKWSSDSMNIAFGGQYGELTVIDAQNGNKLTHVKGVQNDSFGTKWDDSFRWLPNNQQIIRKVVGSIQTLDAFTGKIVNEVISDDNQMCSYGSGSLPACYYDLYWAPDGSKFVSVGAWPEIDSSGSGTEFRKLRVWDTASGKLMNEQKIEFDVHHVTWLPNSREYLVQNFYFGAINLNITDAFTGTSRQLSNIPAPGLTWYSLLWSPDQQRIAIDSSIGIFIIQASNGNYIPVTAPSGITGRIIFWTPDGNQVVFSNQIDGTIYFFEINTGQWKELDQLASFHP